MDEDVLELWCAYPADMAMHEGRPACLPLLDEDELRRMEAFRFEEHRQEFATTRALVRTALSHHAAVPPASWVFHTNAYGKPEIDPAQGLQFNVSNCPGLVVCLIARECEVGVDAESEKRAPEMLELASEVFSKRERTQLEALPSAEQPHRALALWTLKESYTKARGMGMSLPLQQISFLFDESGTIRLELDPALNDRAARWRFCLLRHAGHQIAIVTSCTTAPDLDIWEIRPAHGTPHRLGRRTLGWFPACGQDAARTCRSQASSR
jgi:4'-phosphopantetheinyl transferase